MCNHGCRTERRGINENNQLTLPADVVADIAEKRHMRGPVVYAYFDKNDEKLVITGKDHPSPSLTLLAELNLSLEQHQDFEASNGRVSGRVTLTALNGSRIESRFEQAERAVLKMHYMNEENEIPVWVSVHPKFEFEDLNSSNKAKKVEIDGEEATRNVRHTNHADAY